LRQLVTGDPKKGANFCDSQKPAISREQTEAGPTIDVPGVENMSSKKRRGERFHFPTVHVDEATARSGKHSEIVSKILSDLENLDASHALKIDLAQAGKKKADLRSALHRAAKRKNLVLQTTSDDKHLFVFQRSSRTR
jgi:hypothetical protein